MSKGFTAQVAVNLQAPLATVWKALTDPADIKEYFFGTELRTTWEVGTPLVFSGEWNGVAYEDRGTVLQFVPNDVVQYDYWSSMSNFEDTPDKRQTITYRLKAEPDGSTQLEILQENIASEESKSHSEASWLAMLEGLRGLVERT